MQAKFAALEASLSKAWFFTNSDYLCPFCASQVTPALEDSWGHLSQLFAL